MGLAEVLRDDGAGAAARLRGDRAARRSSSTCRATAPAATATPATAATACTSPPTGPGCKSVDDGPERDRRAGTSPLDSSTAHSRPRLLTLQCPSAPVRGVPLCPRSASPPSPAPSSARAPSRRIRRANKVPAVLYGHGEEPRHFTLPGHELMLALKHDANALLTLETDDGDQLALPKVIVRDPIKGHLEHVDLVAVRKGEKVTVEVPSADRRGRSRHPRRPADDDAHRRRRRDRAAGPPRAQHRGPARRLQPGRQGRQAARRHRAGAGPRARHRGRSSASSPRSSSRPSWPRPRRSWAPVRPVPRRSRPRRRGGRRGRGRPESDEAGEGDVVGETDAPKSETPAE